MTRRRWDELEEPFKRLLFRDGVDRVALRVPMHRATAYRLLRGDIKKPYRRIRRGVERVLDDESRISADDGEA